MLRLIITNELEHRLNRKATFMEQRKAYLYVSDNLGDKPSLKTLTDLMDDYIDDTYVKCAKCGEWVLRENTTEITGPYHNYRVCSNSDCEQQAYYDAHTDPYQELRTY